MENLTKRQKWVLNQMDAELRPFQLACWKAEGTAGEKETDEAFGKKSDELRSRAGVR